MKRRARMAVNLLSTAYQALPVVVLNGEGVEVGRQDFLEPIACPNFAHGKVCGHCWYCNQAVAK